MPSLIKVKVEGKLVKQGLQNLSAEIPKIGRNQIYQVMVRSKKELRKEVPRPTYPIQWDSPRQKIKVIILLRYVLGMPYQRRGIYQKAFNIEKNEDGYTLVNESERAVYLSGDADGQGQSRIHRGRWPLMRDVVDNEMTKLPTAVVAHIVIVAKEQGFDAKAE